jgi:hypothetical protein
MSDPSLVALPPEEKLKAIAERLRDKVADWGEWGGEKYCYDDGEAARDEGKALAYEQAADDLEWILRAFGLEKS